MEDAFSETRFRHAKVKPGAAGFATGMPSFAPLYALNVSLRYLEKIGVETIDRYATPLVEEAYPGLQTLGITPLASLGKSGQCSGIISFLHPRAETLHAELAAEGIALMQHAGRLCLSIHPGISRLLRGNIAGYIHWPAGFLQSCWKALGQSACTGARISLQLLAMSPSHRLYP